MKPLDHHVRVHFFRAHLYRSMLKLIASRDFYTGKCVLRKAISPLIFELVASLYALLAWEELLMTLTKATEKK